MDIHFLIEARKFKSISSPANTLHQFISNEAMSLARTELNHLFDMN